MNCEGCLYYIYDEDYEEYICTADMDEDDYGRLMQSSRKQCPFWRSGG